MARRTVAALAAAAVVVLAGAQAETQQPPAPASPQDIMPALLAEVRALRVAMESMSSAGARVQLAIGRLQLQEQRLNTAIKRLDDARTRLSDLQRSFAEQQEQAASLETSKDGAGGFGAFVAHAGADRPAPEMIEEMKGHFKRQLERTNVDIQRLIAEEATLAADVATEQARWTDFNQRLEDIERSLMGR